MHYPYDRRKEYAFDDTDTGSGQRFHRSDSGSVQDIGEAKAKSIALEHTGVSEAEVTRLCAYQEYDDGILEYHVEFCLGNTEYEYEILAADGRILDFEKDADD